MTSREVAAILHEIETLLDLHGADEFRSKAYGRAARSLEAARDLDLHDAVAHGTHAAVPGVGKGLWPEIVEIISSGTSTRLEELRALTPPGLLDMLRIRGLGARKVRAISSSLGITTLSALENACRENAVASLSGFGPKSQANILDAIEELKRNAGHARIDVADTTSRVVVAFLSELPSVTRVEVVGRLRRGAEIFDRVALLAVADVDRLCSDLRGTTTIGNIDRNGSRITGVAPDGLRVVVECTDERRFPLRLFQLTGSADHVTMVAIALEQKGLLLDEHGIRQGDNYVPIGSESDLYRHAGISFIHPEVREGIDEVRRGLDGTLEAPIDVDDFVGMIHVHSTWSDGLHSISDLAEHVRRMGYQYLLITDHSKSAFYANGLDEKRLLEQGREIDALNNETPANGFMILKGIECDILADGSLDLDDDVLSTLDAVVVSIHSRFDLSREAQTDRLVTALRHPAATILGHPTGRLLLGRKGYEIDHKRVIDAAADAGKAIEINANPRRLDLSWRMVRYAVTRDVPIAISPDAHTLAHFEYMKYGVAMARKGGLPRRLAVNMMSPDELRAIG